MQASLQLGEFLGDNRGALQRWFGANASAQIRANPDSLRGFIDRDVIMLDGMIARQLDEILHHPSLQRLEGSWRGLFWLADGLDPVAQVTVRVLSLTWREAARDLDRAIEFDQSLLFQLIYEAEFGTAGGEPYGLLVIDHELRHRPAGRDQSGGAPVDDVSTIASLASVAAAAFAPIVIAASPALLGVDRFEDLALSLDPAAAMRGPDYARWQSMTLKADMRFVGAVLPRVLARPPWRPDPRRTDGFRYRERTPTSADRCWSVACYAFALAVARAHALFGWPADIRGAEPDRVGGGLVFDLAAEPFCLGPDTMWDRAPVDLIFTDAQEQSLASAGLMPLAMMAHGDEAVFASVGSLQSLPPEEPGREPTPAAANAQRSTQLNTMLCVSRFAHTLKVMGRELVGSLATSAEVERRLQSWLSGYTNTSVGAGIDSRARHPLLSSAVKVQEVAGRPGNFTCVMQLQPYYQIDDVSASFRLVTNLTS